MTSVLTPWSALEDVAPWITNVPELKPTPEAMPHILRSKVTRKARGIRNPPNGSPQARERLRLTILSRSPVVRMRSADLAADAGLTPEQLEELLDIFKAEGWVAEHSDARTIDVLGSALLEFFGTETDNK